MARNFSWTAKQVDKLNKVLEVLEGLKEYQPLTLRQIYYQLVSQEFIENTVSQYAMLSNLLKWARIDGHVPWEAVEDRVRAFHNSEGWQNKEDFLSWLLDSYLSAYRRNLWQDQERYVEVWIEKDALSAIFTRTCSQYGVSVVVCRGFASVSFLHDFKSRLVKHSGRDPVMLYFGDFDPSGVEMLRAMRTTLSDELNVDLEFRRVALLRDDIFQHRLPHNPNALKRSDTRAKKHLESYGEPAVELDALRPDVLEQKIETAIKAEVTDVKAFNVQVDRFTEDKQELQKTKQQFLDVL